MVALHWWHDPAVEAARQKAITRTTIPLSTIRFARRPSSCSSWNGDSLELSARVRGGGSSDDDAATAEENDGTAHADAAEKKSFSARFLGSLLDLSNDVKAEAAEDTSSTAASAEDDKIGRGGALVTAKPTRSLPRWLGALDNSRVAPFALRLLPRAAVDDDDESEAPKALPRTTTTTTKTASRSVTERVVARAKSVQKVWWVDTWADQLPTSEQDEEELLAAAAVEQELERRSTMDIVEVNNASAAELAETKPEEVKNKDHDEDEEINVEQASSSFPSLPGDDEEKEDAIAQNRTIALEWEAEVVAETLVAIESEAEAATKKHHHSKKKKKKHKTHKKEDAKGEAVLDAASNATVLEEVSGPSADQQNVSTSSDSNVSIVETSPVSAYVSSGYVSGGVLW